MQKITLNAVKILLTMVLASPALAGPRVAILGDSLSTGGATHPALKFDPEKLWAVFNDQALVTPKIEDIPNAAAYNLPAPLQAPPILWPVAREYRGGFEWVIHNTLRVLGYRFLDTEEYSWGYLTASALGVRPQDILIAAEDGARTEQIPRHIDRVLAVTNQQLPEKVFIFYTGNDLCAPVVTMVPDAEAYSASLKNGFDYILKVGKPAAGGSDVYVVGFLGLLQLLHAPDILAKQVYAFGETVSCKALRENGYGPSKPNYQANLPADAWYFSRLMPPNPAGFCPTLFATQGSGQEWQEKNISTLANRIREYREAQRAEVTAANRRASEQNLASAVRFHYLDATSNLIFTGEDIAGDCFHLSTIGQERVAKVVVDSLR
jgi:hypothetical protein